MMVGWMRCSSATASKMVGDGLARWLAWLACAYAIAVQRAHAIYQFVH